MPDRNRTTSSAPRREEHPVPDGDDVKRPPEANRCSTSTRCHAAHRARRRQGRFASGRKLERAPDLFVGATVSLLPPYLTAS
jgi:hypothetical protein